MRPGIHRLAAACVFTLLCIECSISRAISRQTDPQAQAQFARIQSLGLAPRTESHLRQTIAAHEYVGAEKILLAAIPRAQNAAQKARLLAFTGGIYYLDRDYFNAAVAWNKSAAIAPLPPNLQFTLAMTYVQMDHPDWARSTLAHLARKAPDNALYPYWIGRLDYGSQLYNQAILQFQQAIRLAPGMARAYNNLGLCYYYLNQNQLAIRNYKKAIELDYHSAHPSAWPYLNLAITLEFMNRPGEAETDLREAIRLDPTIPSAYFQLGNVYEHSGKLQDAVREYKIATRLDNTYAEPHFALARIYQRLGERSLASSEVKTYLHLHNHPQPSTSMGDTPKN